MGVKKKKLSFLENKKEKEVAESSRFMLLSYRVAM